MSKFSHSTLRLVEKVIAISILLLSIMVCCKLSMAQSTGKPDTSVKQSKKTAENAKDLLQKIEDLQELAYLSPLKLTDDQVQKLIPLLKKLKISYDSDMDKVGAAHLNPLSDEISRAWQNGLLSQTPADSVNHDINTALEAILKDRHKRNLENIGAASTAVQAMLTPHQVDIAVQIVQKLPENADRSPKASQSQWFNLWVGEGLLSYGRIVPLLESMHKVMSAPASEGSTKGDLHQADGGK